MVKVVHVLHAGRALCGTMPYPPSSWPEGHVWISIDGVKPGDDVPDDRALADVEVNEQCASCFASPQQQAARHAQITLDVHIALGPKAINEALAIAERDHNATQLLKVASPDDHTCPRCASKLVDAATPAELTSTPGRIDRRECTRDGCDFWVSLSALERLNRPKALPLVTHTIEHLHECPVRSTPLDQIPFSFGTPAKLAAAGCNCPVTFKVKA